ncbi:NADH-quinone oxidoreductase subunit NuoK [Campylobacter corcagiensis]|uniref:NADH-quinone oxidoreductase subunit K n=1 Tax=Campylobacter corcagiensis TaxID=1448857 RepID=A0A7M1LHH3_9BACT|nr:NADH-quinone oxidoreductase subunit NuoK [Campylobacter corcagiensis]QKF64005.1 NADH:quinone oxidoreductase I, membrane subunit K [Campylobacter corcagiensis]QOQ87793.1 NADH-quinone oxidoreductase subunit NuoK [Campylobacter corcagiensis]
MSVGVNHYLFVAIVMFVLGLVGVMKRKNLLMLFFSSEIMLNAANLALVAISVHHKDLNAQAFALFVIVIAASELAVGLALLIRFYKKTGSIEIENLSKDAL